MKKKILVGLLVVTGVAVLTAGVYATWLMTPPGMPDSADEAASVITSARFARLPIERKEAYIARMRELISQMSDEERRAFFEANRDNRELREATREVFEAMALEQARGFAAADPSMRISMLDNAIDNMAAMRAEFGRRGGFGGRGPGGPGGEGRRGPDNGEDQPQATGEDGTTTEQAPPQRLRPEEMTPEQLAEFQQERQERINERMNEMQAEAATGNPQDDALMQEYRRALRERMQQRGMDTGRRGGGPGGGGQRGRG